MPSFSFLPPEIAFMVFQAACSDDGSTARSLASVSRSFYVSALPLIYRVVAIHDLDRVKMLVEHFERDPIHATYVQHVFLAERSPRLDCAAFETTLRALWGAQEIPYGRSAPAKRSWLFCAPFGLVSRALAYPNSMRCPDDIERMCLDPISIAVPDGEVTTYTPFPTLPVGLVLLVVKPAPPPMTLFARATSMFYNQYLKQLDALVGVCPKGKFALLPAFKRSMWDIEGYDVDLAKRDWVDCKMGGSYDAAAFGSEPEKKRRAASNPNSPAAESSAASMKNAIGRFATATDPLNQVPIYPATTNTAAFTNPTFGAQGAREPPANNVRPDRPRIIAPAYKWAALPTLIQTDPYLKGWNDTIFGNATNYYNQDVKAYYIDGGSGVLDIAREVKERIKAFAYAYRMTNDTKWVDRAWKELQNAAGNGTAPFGTTGDNWYTKHFSMSPSSLLHSLSATTGCMMPGPPSNASRSCGRLSLSASSGTGVNGNWNCVCNGGLTLGALAILGDDPTEELRPWSSSDGTWSETPNYWYFGTTGHAEMSSSLMSATGSDYNLIVPDYNLTGLYHMHVTGMTSMFNYGDHGPNKFTATANSMMWYASHFKMPQYMLFQRDRVDAAEPWSMFWYDPTVAGAFWDGMPLDHYFDDNLDQWAAMRTSWTDNNGVYVAIKSGNHTGHQTHGDLDAGDLSSMPWVNAGLLHRLLYPDLTQTYNGQSIKRGIRFINGRKQVLLQDDLNNVSQSVEWRMHTNATVTIGQDPTTATLSLGEQTMQVKILNAGQGVGFSTKEAVRASTDPALPAGQTDQPNPGVTVLCITLATGGTQSLQVLFNPQWSGMSESDFKTPAVVAIDQWSLTSHN
ncbi:hypothetical protein RhiLY_11010 [Ceratobasidium sp. AG-Ba]|nr:hypothetical protein RhiLY_11010 [Ceratobasidium sp. AG-Ba]